MNTPVNIDDIIGFEEVAAGRYVGTVSGWPKFQKGIAVVTGELATVEAALEAARAWATAADEPGAWEWVPHPKYEGRLLARRLKT